MQIQQNNKIDNQIFRIIHFNDCYDIQPSINQPYGGAARFNTAIHHFKNQNTLTLFSGDIFSPSVVTNKYKGAQMIKPLNLFGIDVACYGNHDLDVGEAQLINLKNQTNFPWLLSNGFRKNTEQRFGQADQYCIKAINGFKIGIFALAQQQWINVIRVQYVELISFKNFIKFGQIMVKKLREQQKCDFIIALTHMMGYNDIKLAQNVKGIDFILGGHDHTIKKEKVNESLIIKSGSNFKNLTVLKIISKNPQQIKKQQISLQQKFVVDYNLVQINSKFTPDPVLEEYIRPIYKQIEEKAHQTYYFAEVDLDLRFSSIRVNQNSYMNLISDIYKFYFEADCAYINSGNFRADTIVKAGAVSYSILTNHIQAHPVMIQTKGENIYQLLQNLVSLYPNFAGRMGTVSGINFSWNKNNEAYNRVIKSSITINNEKIDFEKKYKIATHYFLAEGGDGFGCLKGSEYIISKNIDRTNIKIILEMFDPQNKKCKEFCKKYPEKFHIIQKQNKSFVSINPNPFNQIRMFRQQ